ncbi:MAG TPA: hypothetical protein VGM41_14575 [Chitinophagaceae bacterium]|jgi:hypothetical protein
MKKIKAAFIALSIATAGVFAFTPVPFSGSIRGTVSPAEGAVRVWAISNSDTAKGNLQNGAFEITTNKEGVFRVIVEALPPYRNASKDNISVANGQSIDVGQINLEK